MERFLKIETHGDLIRYLTIALEHEWAVSIEYLFHAYAMPKGKFFYEDPIMKLRNDVRGQWIQIGIDEMYHALQLGLLVRQMGGTPSFKTDEVIRFPKVVDNLERDRKTEDLVTDLYQSAEFKSAAYPKVQNMVLNISYDEVRHSKQFGAMIAAMHAQGAAGTEIFRPKPENDGREDVRLIHEIARLENELMHRYLKFVFLFSDHQDLGQRLFKNSIDHMRHWDKMSGILVKLGRRRPDRERRHRRRGRRAQSRSDAAGLPGHEPPDGPRGAGPRRGASHRQVRASPDLGPGRREQGPAQAPSRLEPGAPLHPGKTAGRRPEDPRARVRARWQAR